MNNSNDHPNGLSTLVQPTNKLNEKKKKKNLDSIDSAVSLLHNYFSSWGELNLSFGFFVELKLSMETFLVCSN